MDLQLKNKTALITGASTGIGRSIAMQRISQLPDVPTVAEMGYKDFKTSQWYGILAVADQGAKRLLFH